MGSMTQECEKFRLTNATYIDMFHKDLLDKGLKAKIIEKHYNNVNFYLNVYLLREDVVTMKDGTLFENINGFLGDFFIRKCMWSSPGTLKATATSIKKFYKCMLTHQHISEENYQGVKEIIKESLDDWLKDCFLFNQ